MKKQCEVGLGRCILPTSVSRFANTLGKLTTLLAVRCESAITVELYTLVRLFALTIFPLFGALVPKLGESSSERAGQANFSSHWVHKWLRRIRAVRCSPLVGAGNLFGQN